MKVILLHTRRRFLGRRQPWRWVAHAANGRILAVSSEHYTNRADALDAITLLFGADVTVETVWGDK